MRLVRSTLLGLLAVSCAPKHGIDTIPKGDGPLVALYSAAIDAGGGGVRHARVSIWAQSPDRIHAELRSPVGGLTYVLDAGDGKACIVDVGAAIAYAGQDDPAAFEALVGLRLSAVDAVAALLSGVPPAGVVVKRDAPGDGRLPDSIRIEEGARSITLSRLKFERGAVDAALLGTGRPPSGLSVKPIETLGSTGR